MSWDELAPVGDDDQQRYEYETGASNMVEINSVYGGNSLKAADLQGTEPTVIIESVAEKQFDKSKKLVIRFVGKEKVLICNKTNAQRIAFSYGTNTDAWVGQRIQLYIDLVSFQGNMTPAIRVRPAPAVQPAQAPVMPRSSPGVLQTVMPPAPAYNELNPPPSDDIPF